jgi:hypothetical protein
MAQLAGELTSLPLARVPPLPALPRWNVVLWLGTLTLLVGLVAGSYLAYTSSVATSGYSIQRLRAERDVWRARNEQLRLELARVRSLTWVEHEAVARLGMQKPAELTYLRVEPSARAVAGPDAKTADAP